MGSLRLRLGEASDIYLRLGEAGDIRLRLGEASDIRGSLNPPDCRRIGVFGG
jgi:hypothetical protein